VLLCASFAHAERTPIRYLTFETSYQQVDLLRKMIAEFERQNPDIKVNLEATPDATRIFMTDAAAGTPPDVMYIGPENLGQLVEKRIVQPLDPLVARDNVDMSIYYPQTVEALNFDGSLYAMPIHYSTDNIFYNKDLFDRAGVPYPDETWDWETYRDAATTLTEKLNSPGRKDIYGCLTVDQLLMLASYGVQVWDQETSSITVNTPAAVAALKYTTDLMGKQAPSTAQAMDTNDMQLFMNSKVAMYIGRTWQLPRFMETMGDIRWDVAPVPIGPAGRACIFAVGGNCIAKASKHPEEAWRFAKFYTSVEGQKFMGLQKNCVPAIKELSTDPTYFLSAPPDNIGMYLKAVEYAKIPFPNRSWQNEFQRNVWFPNLALIKLGRLSIEQALKNIDKDGNELIVAYRADQAQFAMIDEGTDSTVFILRLMYVLMALGLVTILVVARSNRRYWEGYAFVGVWIIGFIAFMLGPVIASLYLSFCRYDLLTPPRWVGMANFIELMSDEIFLRSLINTIYFAAVQVPLSLGFALLLAVMLNNKLKGIYTFRAIYYLPALTSGVAIALLWRWIFNPELGLFNSILRFFQVDRLLAVFGVGMPEWLVSPTWAMPSIIIMSIWGGMGASMLIYLAGLQGIPDQLYEAADIDGASKWQKFRNVTIPMLSPSIFFNLIMAVIGSFQVFTTVFVMTSNTAASQEPGGPANSTMVYVLYLYMKGFRDLYMGKACAMAWILFVIILALTLLNTHFSKKWVHYDQV
jgi:multiple sugar transport system permease protein